MNHKQEHPSLISEQELHNLNNDLFADREQSGPVTCFGMEFENDEARREYFRAELRKKLPELRHIEGFPIGEDDDIIALSDPPYYTACPNPWLNELKSENDYRVNLPFSDDLSVDDRNKIYSYHPYHTKVPPQIIEDLISYYTSPSDLILDIFCGSGMAGVAAHKCGRKSIQMDLSPVAAYISHINTTNFDFAIVNNVLSKIIDKVEKELGWVYATKENGRTITANYFVWADVFECPSCHNEFPIFPHGVIHHGNKVETRKEFACPHCGLSLNVRKIQRIITQGKKLSVLVWVNAGSGKTRINREVSSDDVAIIEKINFLFENGKCPWFPMDTIDPERYSAKLAQLGQKKITDISRFLSTRNLLVFSTLWNEISKIGHSDIRIACQSMLTSIFTVISERQGYFGGGGGMSGNLYMPIVRMEKNIFDTLRRKLKKFIECEQIKSKYKENCFVSNQSSTSLSNIPSNSIDFIFTDPPFGANIMYSEMNLILEGWLKIRTNNAEEAIIDESTGKSANSYSSLLSSCFKECYRVLKPGHWMCVEFHNTQASIWNVLQNAITSSGLVIAQVLKLDKGGTTILADIRPGAAVQDLIINCYKRDNETISEFGFNANKNIGQWGFIDEHLKKLRLYHKSESKITPNIERSSRILYDRLVSYFLQKGAMLSLNLSEFQSGLKDRYVERDGVYFTPEQVVDYEKAKSSGIGFVPMGLIVSDEANGIEWLKIELQTPQTYKELQPKWIKALGAVRKNDIIPELRQLLEENFIEEANGKWRLPNIQDDKDVAALRTKALMREFKLYVEQASKPKGKIKEARVEALRTGFKQCYIDKDFKTIVMVGDRIPANLRDEDEVLLQFYDIALNKI